jgi:A/G-specific adenine glycosylase
MELGALVCTPRQPRCEACPIRRHCTALATQQIDSLPNLGKRAPATARRVAAFLVQRDGCWLVRQRPTDGVNARLWEFPNVELAAQTSDLAPAAAHLLGCKPAKLVPLCLIKHSITRHRISLEAWFVTTPRQPRAVEGSKWLTLEELDSLPFSSAHRKILRKLRDVGAAERRAGLSTQAGR